MYLKIFFLAKSKIFSGYFVKHLSCNMKELFTSIHKNDNVTEKKLKLALKFKKSEKAIQPYLFCYFCTLLFLHT